MSNSAVIPKRKALVTGSSSGIGEAIVKALAKLDYQLVITGRSQSEIHRVANECFKLSPSRSKPLEIIADLGNESDLRRLAESSEIFFDRSLSLLVNNAALSKPVPIDQVDNCFAAYKHVMRVNMDSVVWLTLRMAKSLKNWADLSGETGSVVNISSIGGQRAIQSPFSYSCSKACMNMFSHCMASQLAPSIRVNTVSPGPIETKIIERSGLSQEIFKAAAEGLTALRRCGKPEDVAEAVIYLADHKRASFVTGSNIMVDGGVNVMPIVWQP